MSCSDTSARPSRTLQTNAVIALTEEREGGGSAEGGGGEIPQNNELNGSYPVITSETCSHLLTLKTLRNAPIQKRRDRQNQERNGDRNLDRVT